jgi:hypothetical protein
MFCLEVQDLISSIVELVHDINVSVERWQSNVSTVENDRREETSTAWYSLYQRLATDICPRSARFVQYIENDGHQVEGKNEFLRAWGEVRGITGFSLESVTSSIEQVRHGNVYPLGDVTNELWDAPVREG